jgi:hypothetical protein
VRRWNNDLFVGIAKDISCSHTGNPQKGAKIANIYAEAEMNKARYTMPFAPRHHWTAFCALMEGSTMNSRGKSFQGQSEEDGQDEWEMERKVMFERNRLLLDPEHLQRVRERFLQGEVSGEYGHRRCNGRGIDKNDLYGNGYLMVQINVNKRLLNVILRTCRMPGFTRNVVDAFEHVLVKNMSVASRFNGDNSGISDHDEIWNKVLIQKPFITTRRVELTENKEAMEKMGVTVRMIFSSQDEKRAAFNRLLLHAVCQFHGLEVSSSTTSKGHKMLTVTGVCTGSQFRLLDFVSLDDESDHVEKQSSCEKSLESGMASLQVQ